MVAQSASASTCGAWECAPPWATAWPASNAGARRRRSRDIAMGFGAGGLTEDEMLTTQGNRTMPLSENHSDMLIVRCERIVKVQEG